MKNEINEAHSSVVVDPVRHDNGGDLIDASKRTARDAAIEYNEKARSIGKGNDALQPEPMSERKRKSFEFYDQLPEPLRTQAKENFDEDYSTVVPTDLEQAIDSGWYWRKSKYGDANIWGRVPVNAGNGVYNNQPQVMMVTDPTQPSPELLDAYNLLSSEGKKEMRAKYPAIKWPEVKRYVSYSDYNNSPIWWVGVPDNNGDKPFTIYTNNCRPEIDEEKGEIRFVKIG